MTKIEKKTVKDILSIFVSIMKPIMLDRVIDGVVATASTPNFMERILYPLPNLLFKGKGLAGGLVGLGCGSVAWYFFAKNQLQSIRCGKSPFSPLRIINHDDRKEIVKQHAKHCFYFLSGCYLGSSGLVLFHVHEYIFPVFGVGSVFLVAGAVLKMISELFGKSFEIDLTELNQEIHGNITDGNITDHWYSDMMSPTIPQVPVSPWPQSNLVIAPQPPIEVGNLQPNQNVTSPSNEVDVEVEVNVSEKATRTDAINVLEKMNQDDADSEGSSGDSDYEVITSGEGKQKED